MNKRKHFIALSLASIGAIGAFASVNAASLPAGTTTATRDKVRTDIKQAVTNGDYQAFLAATKNNKAGTVTITEAQFSAMVSANKLRASGDIAGAKKLLDEAGIKPPTHSKKSVRGDHGLGKETATLTDAQKAIVKQAQTLFKAGKQGEAQALLDKAGIKTSLHKKGNSSKIKKFIGSFNKAPKTITSTTTQ